MISETDQEIQALIDKYQNLAGTVDDRLHQVLTPLGTQIQITHRIKTMESIKEKMIRKADHYQSVYDLNDILGFRVICNFSIDADNIAKRIAESFRVNWSRSKDKRKLIDANSFGYLAIHYICALPADEGDLSNLWFEIQIRTILQNSYAEIEHDLGYKTEIEVPRNIRRSFSRAASLLETADIIFSEIRNKLEDYETSIQEDIEKGRLDEIYFDRITLNEFTACNPVYLNLLNEIAAITRAHIAEGRPENLLEQIDFLAIKTVGDMVRIIEENSSLALNLARRTLHNSELDELSSTVAYHYLFRARLITGGYSRERIREFFMLNSSNERTIERNTEMIIRERENLLK